MPTVLAYRGELDRVIEWPGRVAVTAAAAEKPEPPFWGQLDATIAGGAMRSPEDVREELAKGTDGLVETLNIRDGLFVPLDTPLMDAMAEVMARCPTLTDISGERNRADPFVIALAHRDGGKVVSDERLKKPAETRLRIPDGCQEFGVPCLKWFDFLREIGWTL